MGHDQLQAGLQKRSGHSPVGRYQMLAGTVSRLKTKMSLADTDIYTPELQDRMGRELLSERGYDDYLAGKVTSQQLQARLAKEWDSLSALNGRPFSDKA